MYNVHITRPRTNILIPCIEGNNSEYWMNLNSLYIYLNGNYLFLGNSKIKILAIRHNGTEHIFSPEPCFFVQSNI